jgi:flagellar motor switch protein FliN
MAPTFTLLEYSNALVAELATAIEAVLGGSVTAAAGTPSSGGGWAVTFAATGELAGTITAWMDRSGSTVLAQRVTGMDDAPDDEVVADMLKEMWSQAAGALSLKAPFTGVTLALSGPMVADANGSPLAAYTLAIAPDVTAQIAVSGAAQVVAAAVELAPAADVAPRGSRRSPSASANLEVVLDIDLPLVVRFGRTMMTLKALAALGPGSILDMGRSPDEPVEILVGEQVIARGEVVVVAGNYGVRITDLVSPSDRVKAMEA